MAHSEDTPSTKVSETELLTLVNGYDKSQCVKVVEKLCDELESLKHELNEKEETVSTFLTENLVLSNRVKDLEIKLSKHESRK